MKTTAEVRHKPGGGRRAVDGSTKVERVTITLTREDRDALRLLGGSPWIRSKIREDVKKNPKLQQTERS